MLSPLVFAGALLLASQAPSSWVVLVKTDGSVPPSWSQNLQDAVKSAAEASGAVKWVAPPQVSLEDAQLALGCGGWGPACVGQIAGMMNAEKALLLEIEARGEGAWMTYEVITTAGVSERKPVRFELPDRGRDGLKVARVVAASAVTGKPITVVTLKTDVPGAEVVIDGEKRGKTPLTLADQLPPGQHRVELRLEGRAPVTQTIQVRAGEVTRVGAVMSAGGPGFASPTVGSGGDVQGDPPPPGSADVASIDPLFGYLTLGAAGAVALVGGGLYLGYLAYWQSKLPNPCGSAEDLSIHPDQRSCESQREAVERLNREGDDIERTMNALYGSVIVAEIVAAALALTGAGLVIAALLSPPPDEMAAP